MVIDQLNSNGGAVVNWCFVQVGVFKDLESKDCEDFLSVVDVLRSKYSFTQTLDSSCVPHTSADRMVPGVHLYKNFGEDFDDATVGSVTPIFLAT